MDEYPADGFAPIGGSGVPILTTPRTILRGHNVTDFEDSARMWADENVVRHITGKPSGRSESWGRLLRYAGHWQFLGFGYWVLEDRKTGTFLGEIGFANHRRDIKPSLGDNPEIGWVLATPAHGKGLATEAVQAALRWGDRELDHGKTVCIFDPDHSASIRVATKNGYVESFHTTYLGQKTLVMERPRPG